MSTSPIDELVGLRLTSHESVEDYVQFTFEDGAAVLSVYNPFQIQGSEPGATQTATSMIGRRLLAISTLPSLVELRFDEGYSVKVDIRDEAYSGPEAMVLHRPGKSPVVWT